MRKIFAAACALSVTACTWVEPSPQGRAVTLVQPIHVANCRSLGSVTATTAEQVWIFARGEKKVDEELVSLARNKAATLGGDTIVAEGAPSDGSQAFRVYRCN